MGQSFECLKISTKYYADKQLNMKMPLILDLYIFKNNVTYSPSSYM